eukprot:scaffold115285_cov37-Phaeocystis_antarctica.AAC.1
MTVRRPSPCDHFPAFFRYRLPRAPEIAPLSAARRVGSEAAHAHAHRQMHTTHTCTLNALRVRRWSVAEPGRGYAHRPVKHPLLQKRDDIMQFWLALWLSQCPRPFSNAGPDAPDSTASVQHADAAAPRAQLSRRSTANDSIIDLRTP